MYVRVCCEIALSMTLMHGCIQAGNVSYRPCIMTVGSLTLCKHGCNLFLCANLNKNTVFTIYYFQPNTHLFLSEIRYLCSNLKKGCYFSLCLILIFVKLEKKQTAKYTLSLISHIFLVKCFNFFF